MDSGNSGSMQSSSCGDEIDEYDSRAEPNFSMFLNNQVNPPSLPTTTRVNHLLNTPSSSLQHHHTQMFDPSLYMDSLQKSSPSSLNQNSFLNLDMVWSKATVRSEPNNTDLSSLMVPLSSSSSSQQQNQQQQQQAFLLSQLAGQTQTIVNVASIPTTQQQHSLPQETSSRVASLTNNDQNLNNNNNMVRNNPKKRSRASRRAPTTVLTTDTTNFRAMVQEFTGIPAQPFSSPFPRTRLDLFGSSRSISTTHMEPPPPYLLRPFAQKIQPFSPMIPSSFPSLENLASSNNNSTNSPSINYHLSQQNNLHHPMMQHNQILGFQSISQTPTKYPIGVHQPSLEISPSTINSRMKMGTVFEEIGLSHVDVNHNNNNIGVVHHHQNNNNMRNSEDQWGQRTSTINGNNDDDSGRIVSGNEERVSNGTDFGVEKGQECAVTTRGEGTVESWINCSSSD